MDLDPNNFSGKQLREWLRQLGKPTWGSKAMLITRLNEVTPEERGTCPIIENETGETTVDEGQDDDNEEAEVSLEIEQQSESDPSEINEELLFQLNAIKKELDNVRKECKFLEKENLLLKKTKGVKCVEPSNVQENAPMATIGFLKEIMIDYDGDVNVDVWAGQFKNVGETFNVDKNTLRALFVSKMKGKAQQWLQQVPYYVSKQPDELLKELQIYFGNQTNKLKSRKIFENRKWNPKESFMQYCNNKILLANTFAIPEEELVEYIIDGIPDQQLRTHASLMCITTTTKLMRAFSNIELKPANNGPIKTTAAVRCFNCNSNGHYATDCRKPKREPGSCYVCGSKNHIAVNCQQRKMPVMTVEDREYNEYVRYFNIAVVNVPKCSIFAECLIDSGSPACFLKIKCLKNLNVKLQKNDNGITSYVGINKSPLFIYGKLECFIEFRKQKIHVDFLIVANESMGYDAILGRNFMKKCKLKLVMFKSENDRVAETLELGKNYDEEKIYEHR